MFGQDFLSRHMPAEPLDLMFNAMVMTMANRTNPYGWEVTDSYVTAPHSLGDLNALINSGRMVVWGGGSEKTIYACPEHNAAFRAWHDMTHWTTQQPMTIAGEAVTVYHQIWQMLQDYGHDDETQRWAELLLIEVLGQALQSISSGEFKEDQMQFTKDRLEDETFRIMAARICVELADEDCTGVMAQRLAEETWGHG